MKNLYSFYKKNSFKREFSIGKRQIKFIFPVSSIIKTVVVLSGIGAFFVGALLFQGMLVGVGTPGSKGAVLKTISGDLSIAATVLCLLFGTATLVLFGLMYAIEKKYEVQVATMFMFLLFFLVASSIVFLSVGASVYVLGE